MNRYVSIGVGCQTEGSPYEKGLAASKEALRQVGGETPAFALLLGGNREGEMEILKGVSEVLGKCPLLGCVSDPYPSLANALQIILFASPHLTAKIGVGRVIKDDWQKGISEAFMNSYIMGSGIRGGEMSREKTLRDWYLYRRPSLAIAVMISQPSKSRQREKMLVSYLGRKFHGRVPILMYSYSPEGGLPLVFADNKIVREGIVMAIIKTDLQFSLERFHNFEPLGIKLFATKAEGRRILEFNDKPALVEYFSALAEKTGEKQEELAEWGPRHPLAYRGRGGRYHIIIPEETAEDLSITLPLEPEPDLPLYPMTFIQSREEEFYESRMITRNFANSQDGDSVLIMRNCELADRPPLHIKPSGEGPDELRIIEIKTSARLRAYLPEEYWEGESSHISFLIRNSLDPIAVAAVEQADLLGEVLRLKELNQKVFDGIGYGIAVLDNKLKIQHSNNTYQAMMSPKGEEWNKENCRWKDCTSSSCPTCVVEEVIGGKSFSSIEMEKTYPDGEKRWVRIDAFPLRDAKGNISSAIEVIRDISNIKNLQISLQREKTKMEAVINGIAESLYIVNRDMDLQFFHGGALSIPTETGPDFMGMKCHEYMFKRNQPCPWCRVAETFRSGRVIRRIAYVKGKKGDDNYYHMTFSPWRDEEGQVVSAICLLVDITNQRRMEQQLIRSEKLNSLAVLSAGMAHELNNPLGAINFNLEVLKRREKDPSLTEILNGIKKDVGRINRIVGNLRSFSRSGTREYRPIHLHEVADAALDLLGVVIRRGQIEVECLYDPSQPMIQGNFQDLQQVFINLISNAVDAMPAGGKISVSINGIDPDNPQDEIFADDQSEEGAGDYPRKRGFVEFIIADSGMGIAPEIQARIFDPFFTTKPEPQGTGLGLSVVHKILENHSAKISMKSEPGQGTTFTILFPRYAEPVDEQK